jgi:hypothetical protein
VRLILFLEAIRAGLTDEQKKALDAARPRPLSTAKLGLLRRPPERQCA